MTTYTPVTLITGHDDNGNEFFFFRSKGQWVNGYTEMKVTATFIANVILPLVVKVRFGDLEMSRDEWQINGCPFELNTEQMDALRKQKVDAEVARTVSSENVHDDLVHSHKVFSGEDYPLTLDELNAVAYGTSELKPEIVKGVSSPEWWDEHRKR